MKKLATTAAALLVALSTGAAPIAANAASASFSFSVGDQGRYDNYIGSECRNHPNWRGCNDWQHNHRHWSRDDYRNWYMWNRPSLGSFAAGLFGFALGAAAASSNNNSHGDYSSNEAWRVHVQRCEDHYHSYNPNTDKFLGYDGDYHYCTL